MAEAGFYGMNIPQEWGGPSLDVVTQGIITEEMAQVEAGFTFSFYNMGTYFPLIMQTNLSKDDKQSWAKRILSGEARGAFCITEPEAGSDSAAMQTTAVKDGDAWVLNGTKCFVSNAKGANFFLVAAWTDNTKRANQGVTFFLAEKDGASNWAGRWGDKVKPRYPIMFGDLMLGLGLILSSGHQSPWLMVITAGVLLRLSSSSISCNTAGSAIKWAPYTKKEWLQALSPPFSQSAPFT